MGEGERRGRPRLDGRVDVEHADDDVELKAFYGLEQAEKTEEERVVVVDDVARRDLELLECAKTRSGAARVILDILIVRDAEVGEGEGAQVR